MTRARTIAACDASAARGLYADLLPATTYRAWKLSPAALKPVASPIPIDAATLGDAQNAAIIKGALLHKDTLVILETDTGRGRGTVYFYAIKRRARPDYKWNPETQSYAASPHEYAAPLFSMNVRAFEPEEPWKWQPDADVVGIDRTLVEGQP